MKSGNLFILFLAGGIFGGVIVRLFFLDPIQIIGWNIFWKRLFEGRVLNLEYVYESATFLKCATGFLIGGIFSYALGKIVNLKSSKDDTDEN